MDWITENIAIGNIIDIKNISSRVFDSVLCLIENCCSEEEEEYDVMNIPLKDSSGNSSVSIKNAIDFIDDAVSYNEKILVHCHAGRSRSVCIVARYLMLKQGLTSQQALNIIGAKREIYLSPGIEKILNVSL